MCRCIARWLLPAVHGVIRVVCDCSTDGDDARALKISQYNEVASMWEQNERGLFEEKSYTFSVDGENVPAYPYSGYTAVEQLYMADLTRTDGSEFSEE